MLIEDLKILLTDTRRRADLICLMNDLYQRIDRQIGTVQNTCKACKRCCDFGVSGLNLFVTNVELAYFLTTVGPVPEITGARCPFLDDNAGCTTRTARPIGCRTFFCEPAPGYDQGTLYEQALGEIKTFIRNNNLPYFYMEWIQALKSIPRVEFS